MEEEGGRPQQYSIVVRNRPGELAKLTKFLLERSVAVRELSVGNSGSSTAIWFSAPRGCDLSDGLRKSGFGPA